MLKLKEFRTRPQGLSDLLNYASVVADGTILLKNGGLLAGYFFHGNDTSVSTRRELRLLSARVNAALMKLGKGWMVHVDAVRLSSDSYPMPEKAFPDPISQAIDDERRAMFKQEGTQYETAYAILVTYLPPLSIENRFYTFLVDDPAREETKNLASQHLRSFEQALARFESDLSSELRLRRMTGERHTDEFGEPYVLDRLLQYINFTVTGDNHPIRLPPCPMYIDALLGWRNFQHGLAPKIGSKFISILAIDGLPSSAYPSILSYLGQIPCEYRWNTRFIFMDRHEAVSEINAYRRKWKQRVRGFLDQVLQNSGGSINQDALQKLGETEEARRIVESGDANYGYYTSVVVLLSEDQSELEKQSKEVTEVIQKLGFSCRKEDLNATEAWLGSLPGHDFPNIRRPLLHTLNLADLLPLTGIWSGSRYCPSKLFPENSPPHFLGVTGGNTPFRFTTFVEDLGHFLLFGGSSSGKSALLAFMAAQWRRYEGSAVFSFDKGYSQFAIAKGVGGLHFDIAGEGSPLQFCPLQNIDQGTAELSWAEEWIEKLCRLQGVSVLPHHRKAIHTAMMRLQTAKSKTLTEFVATLQDKELREALHHYTLSGPLGSLLDSQVDTLEFSDFQVFEISTLMDLGDKNFLPVLDYIFHRIETRLTGKPTLLLIDEAWLALGHPAFRERIVKWLLTLRKMNVAVGLATQSPQSLVASGILTEIKSSIATIICTAHPNMSDSERAVFASELGFNERQIEIIQGMTRKRDYLAISSEGSRVFQLGLGRKTLSYVGVSGKEKVDRLKDLIRTKPNDWNSIWEKGGLI